MPSLTSYSPYETLAFFQSIARNGSDAFAFQTASAILKQNEHIDHGPNFDEHRFSIESLRQFYEEFVVSENKKVPVGVNGDLSTGERSPKRRKLSTSPKPSEDGQTENERILQALIDRLYLSYKEDIVQQIRKDEEAWEGLQEEIKSLEKQLLAEQESQKSSQIAESPSTGLVKTASFNDAPNEEKGVDSVKKSPSITTDSTPQTSDLQPTAIKDVPNNIRPELSRHDTKSPLTTDSATRLQSNSQHSRPSQPPPTLPSQGQSPGNFQRQMPSSAPHRPNYPPMPSQPTYATAQTPVHLAPQISAAQQRPTHIHQGGQGQGRGSPIPYQSQHTYGPYPQFQPPPPPQWHPHMPAQQYPQHNPYVHPQYYPQPQPGRHPQTPQPMPYPPYPHTAPAPYMQQQQQQWRGQQRPVQSASATTTPISMPNNRTSLPGSGSSTPWKRKQPQQFRTRSPSRPDREISPMTDREDTPAPETSTQVLKKDASGKDRHETPSQRPNRKRGRPASVTPSAIAKSRSQSAGSRTSEGRNERKNMSQRNQKIKAEPPSTPLPVPSSDNEQRSSGRRGRPRSSTVTSQAEVLRPNIMKRKRDTVSPTPSLRSPNHTAATSTSRRIVQTHDPSLVTVSKNFAKTSQLLLSEITSHKLAGIFAKPLSERDAPGYKDFVSRPQDLKSIKAAVSKGSRSALAAIEVLESEHDATPTKAQDISVTSTGAGAIGNGFYLVSKTAELVPPKGIVNSSQLEMELVRMFANAVMFNPLPSSERGFGRSLRLRRNGGDVDVNADHEALSASDGSESGLDVNDEDGIISDAREMFNDVIEIVGKWRDLEVERMGQHTDGTLSRHGSLAVPFTQQAESGRHTSVSASSNIGEDEVMAETEAANTPVLAASSGPGRKRRRVVEH